MILNYKIAGVVVLYHPDHSINKNIKSYIEYLDYLFIIDNSENQNTSINDAIRSMPNVEFISNNANIGMAAALNIAAVKSLEINADYLFTIDQDSYASKDMLLKMLDSVNKISPKSIGIISPRHIYKGAKKIKNKDKTEKVLEVMTSGNLLNLNAYKKTGPFLEKLFIDYIDVEYCLRLNLNSFSVIRVNEAVLHHNLGSTSTHRLLFWTVSTTNHSPLRRYYIARNRLYIYKTYKKEFPQYCRSILITELHETIKIILFENDKLKKIIMTMKGIKDFFNNSFGKYTAQI